MLRETGCFDGDGGEDFSWPEDFKIFISQGVAIECITVASLFSDQSFQCPDDPLGLTAASDYDLAVSALGGCVWYLQRCFIDKDLLSLKSFQVHGSLSSAIVQYERMIPTCFLSQQVYEPLDKLREDPLNTVSFAGQSMVCGCVGVWGCSHTRHYVLFYSVQILDDITLANLDVLDNQGQAAGTLFERLDHTITPFGNIQYSIKG